MKMTTDFLTPDRRRAALAAGTLTPAALLEATLARIAELDPQLNAFIRVTADEARAALPGLPRGPLYGIPVGLKDLYDQRGLPTTAGSALRVNAVAEEDSTVAARLRAAGAVLVGKFNARVGAADQLPLHWPARNP
jgi:amidase